ncbi:MAG: IS1595 family transposase [Caulobacteraceae bacterium]|nr:IS1595 family transposase [Caulobacteraceae bacterium]
MSILSQPQFHDEAAAFAYVEAVIWPEGPVCPHCGGFERISAITPNKEKRIRIGLKFCGQCRKQFTVRVGTIFEESKLPMTKWLQAIFLMVSSKKGVSAHQLHRTLETTYKTAWFLAHRIREAMRSGDLAPFGGAGGVVEADETYIGRDPEEPLRTGGPAHKIKVLSLLDRDTGKTRSMVVDFVTTNAVMRIVEANIAKEAHLITDEGGWYIKAGKTLARHSSINHGKDEYAKYEPGLTISTNALEGYFSIFKRGMRGVYQHASKKHMHRYLAEFDFRYSNRAALGVTDAARADLALAGVVGKRLTYQTAGQRS